MPPMASDVNGFSRCTGWYAPPAAEAEPVSSADRGMPEGIP